LFNKQFVLVGKYDQLRREISEAYPERPVNQFTIVVSATGAFMKQSQMEFARATKLEGKNLARFSRDVVDAEITWSFGIYTDSIARIKYHRDHPLEPDVIQLLEKEGLDCALEDAEKVEKSVEETSEQEPEPGVTKEIEGLRENISSIEKWQASAWPMRRK
jgi:hypothetical protein